MTFLIGFLTGLFGGLLGVGGGIIMIPLMVGILKLNQHKAHGTSLVALVFTGIAGAIAYGTNGTVDVPAAVLMAATAIITARAGAHFAHSLPEWKLKRSFGGFLILVSLLLLLKPCLPAVHGLESGWQKAVVLLLTGIFTGFLSGMMGVGGGVIMIPAMVLLTGFEQHLAQGTSLLTMVPAGAVGAYTHWKLGNVRTALLSGLVPGILIGTYLGGTAAHLLSEGTLRVVFAGVLIWTGGKYLRTKRH
ncbi:MAG: permease [Nitrospirae bacterium GWC2_57_9]|nr:MAG: permease [Nitrospirae bacterium GWC2_57_9]